MKTLPQQISLFTEDESTSLAAGFRANHTAKLVNDLEKKMTATSGQKCLEQFERFGHVGSWAKTFAALLIGMEGWYSTRCRLTWKMKGTKSHRFYFQLAPSTHPTDETESGLLLKTPTAMDGEVTSGKKSPISGNSGTLAQEIMSDYSPTMVKLGLLPTINASDHPGKNTGLRSQDSIPKRIRDAGGKTSQMSPRFIMEMMGFPPDWTELPFQNGETNQSKQEETP